MCYSLVGLLCFTFVLLCEIPLDYGNAVAISDAIDKQSSPIKREIDYEENLIEERVKDMVSKSPVVVGEQREGGSADINITTANTKGKVDTAMSFIIKKLNDGTFIATLVRKGLTKGESNGQYAVNGNESITAVMGTQGRNVTKRQEEEDPGGALYYCVAVICMYAFSILFMIGSSLRQNKQDMEAHCYLKEITGFHNLAKKQDKAMTRKVMEKLGRGPRGTPRGTPIPNRSVDKDGKDTAGGAEGRAKGEKKEQEAGLLGDDLRRASDSSTWSLYSLQGAVESDGLTPSGTPLSTPGLEFTPFLLPTGIPAAIPTHARATATSSLPVWGLIMGRHKPGPEIPKIKVELAPSQESQELIQVSPGEHETGKPIKPKRTTRGADGILHTEL